MSINTAAAAYVASIPAQRATPAAPPAALQIITLQSAAAKPSTLQLPVRQRDEPVTFGRWQAAVAMLAGLAAGAMIVAGVVLPW